MRVGPEGDREVQDGCESFVYGLSQSLIISDYRMGKMIRVMYECKSICC